MISRMVEKVANQLHIRCESLIVRENATRRNSFMSIMSPGFLAILVIVSLLIIWVSFWITNKAYGRKPDVIDPMPSSKKNEEQTRL